MALTSREVGTFWYLPPEVFDENSPKISSKVDIWSIGVIFYQMLYNIKPFGNGLSQSKILYDRVICRASKV
jgi:tousled-like kinase